MLPFPQFIVCCSTRLNLNQKHNCGQRGAVSRITVFILFLKSTTLTDDSQKTQWVSRKPTMRGPSKPWHDTKGGGQADFNTDAGKYFPLASLVSATWDNGFLSVSIHGILILFLCLEREGGRGTVAAGILWMLLFTRDWSGPNSGPLGLLRWNRPQIICPQCHIQQPQVLWTSLSEGYYSLLVWFVLPLASFMSWWVDERTSRGMGLLFWLIIRAGVTAVSVIKPIMMIRFHQAGRMKQARCVWVSEALLRVRFVVGFLTGHARGLSSFPTLDTERMWRRKAWPPHRSHCDLEAWCGAKGDGRRATTKTDSILLPTEFYIQHAARAGHQTSTLNKQKCFCQTLLLVTFSLLCLYFDERVPDSNFLRTSYTALN